MEHTMAAWSSREEKVFRRLTEPVLIQEFLESIPYNTEITCRSPRRVIRDRRANCMEGALFAACALERLGFPPLLVDFRAVRDDDHVIALFKREARWGAVAKSNFSGLRYRSPVYRTLRELVMSYFEQHFNTLGELSMRSYTRPLDLRARRFAGWQWSEEDLEGVGEALDRLPATTIVDRAAERLLRPVDRRLLEAGLLGSDPDGLYKVAAKAGASPAPER